VGSGTLYALGGLLGGVGKAITDDAEQRRQDALLALKRQYDVQDRDARLTTAVQMNNDDNKAKLDAIRTSGEENRSTEQIKAAADVQKIRIKGQIDLNNDKVLEALKHSYNISEGAAADARKLANDLTLAGVTVDHWDVTSDGKMVAFNKQGKVLAASSHPGSFNPSNQPKNEDDGDGSISGQRAARNGKPAPAAAEPAPSKAPSPGSSNIKAQALANLGNVYMEISGHPEKAQQYRLQYPGMFDANGKLLPKDSLIERINQRYGG
jgi:hypothetical protein